MASSSLIRHVSPEGGLYSGQAIVMWSTVCSGAPHSQAALSDRMDELNLPKPVLGRFSIFHGLIQLYYNVQLVVEIMN